MDAGTITAIVGALGVLGAGAKYVIDRIDRKREKREAAVEELLKTQASEAKALAAAVELRYAKLRSTAGKWRDQLIANGIDPLPADWPEEIS